MVMRLRMPGRLKLVFHLVESNASEEGIDIVVIPGVWTPYTQEQRKQACSWLKPLVAATSNDTRVFFYNYELDLDQTSLWQQLIEHGLVLLHAIWEHRQDSQTEQRPLLFICHSLGGVILKRSLWIAHQQYNRFRLLEDVTSGIIFLGTPHTTRNDDKRWDKWRTIMKLNRKEVPRNSLRDDDVTNLADLCRKFEGLNLRIPILSVFEGKETKIRDNLLHSIRGSGTRKQILVDMELGRTGGTYEQTFEASSTHNDLWIIQSDSAFSIRLVEFIKSVSDEAPNNVALLLNKVHINDNFDLRSESTVDFGVGVKTPSRDTSQSTGLPTGRPSGSSNVAAIGALPDFEEPIRGAQLPAYVTNSYSRNTEFFGRQNILEKIDDALMLISNAEHAARSNRELRSVVLCGMGGIGKTEIATEYMFSRKDSFDAVFLLNADTVKKLNDGFSQISNELGLEFQSDRKHDDIATREIVKGWLSEPLRASKDKSKDPENEASWLLIFDNVDDPDILYDFWPTTGTGKIVVTSRNPMAKDSVYLPTASIDVPPFDVEDAGSLLRMLSHREQEPGSLYACLQISETLGGLPLAITQMAAIIRRRHLSLRDFLEYYEEDAKRLQEMPVPGLKTVYNQTIASVWAIESLPDEALALLQVLSLLDPDRIPEELLTEGAKHVKLPHYPVKKAAYFDARTELIRSSLITRNIDLNEIRIHRLVQDVVRRKMTSDQALLVFEATIALISRLWPFVKFHQRNETERLNMCRKLFPHTEKMKSLFQESIQAGELQPSTPSAALFNEVAWYMIERAAGDEIEAFASLSEAILKPQLGKDNSNTKEIKKLLSNSYQYQAISSIDTDGPEAVAKCEAWMKILVELLAEYNEREDALQLASAYTEIGMAYMRKSMEEEAIKSFKQSYEAHKPVDEDSKLDLTWPSIHLGLIYAIRGEGQKGDELLLPVLKQREEVLGKDDTTSFVTGLVLHALANIRVSQNRQDEAINLYQRGLKIYRATIGNNHYLTADNCFKLARQCIRLRSYDEANTLLDQSIKVYGNVRWYKPQAARSSFSKGRLLRDLKRLDIEGAAQLERAMRLRKELVPSDRRKESELSDHDFDELVYYYSR